MPNGYLANIDSVARSFRSMNGSKPKQYGALQFVGIEDVKLQQPEWLWDGMIAKGQFHVMAGESGIGKTQLLCNISAIISRGGIFPSMKESCEKGMVVYLSGEDDLSTTIGPRFVACGGDKDATDSAAPAEYWNDRLNAARPLRFPYKHRRQSCNRRSFGSPIWPSTSRCKSLSTARAKSLFADRPGR